MWVRLTAFVVWAALALAVVFWAFKLLVRPSPVPLHALPVATDQSARGDPLRLFATPPLAVAAAAPAPQASSRFKLVGVMAPRANAGAAADGVGVALIAVDGKPARAYEVGAPVDGEWVLQSVSSRSASIGPEGGTVVARLEVPALPAAATGSLPSAPNDGGASAADNPGPVRAPVRPAVQRPRPAPPLGNRPGTNGVPGVRAPAGLGGDTTSSLR